MKILKKGGVVEKRWEDETKSMPHVPVQIRTKHNSIQFNSIFYLQNTSPSVYHHDT